MLHCSFYLFIFFHIYYVNKLRRKLRVILIRAAVGSATSRGMHRRLRLLLRRAKLIFTAISTMKIDHHPYGVLRPAGRGDPLIKIIIKLYTNSVTGIARSARLNRCKKRCRRKELMRRRCFLFFFFYVFSRVDKTHNLYWQRPKKTCCVRPSVWHSDTKKKQQRFLKI